MTTIFRKTIDEIRREAIRGLEDGGKITNLSSTSVARQLVDIGFTQLSNFYDALEFHARMSQLSTSAGAFLDIIGESRGVARNDALVGSANTQDRAVRFYSKDGTTALTSLLPSSVVPVNTLISSSDSTVSYQVTREVSVDSIQTDVYVPVVATEAGTSFNVGPNVLVLHDLGISTVGVTNDIPISNGLDIEDDASYRFRISRSLDSAAGATEEAIRAAIFGFPDVSEVILTPFNEGLGSFEILLIPVGNSIASDTVEAIRAFVSRVAAFGTTVSVRTPTTVGIELAVQLEFVPKATPVERSQIKSQVRANVLDYIGSIPVGGAFIINEFIQRVMDTSEQIRDMKLLVFRFDKEPSVRRNYQLQSDELLVPQPDSLNAIQVV